MQNDKVIKVRKKPVIVEAIQYDGSSTQKSRIKHWMETGVYVHSHLRTADCNSIVIKTLEGDMTVVPGDWIIKGVEGEFYPCKPKIFSATYETDLTE